MSRFFAWAIIVVVAFALTFTISGAGQAAPPPEAYSAHNSSDGGPGIGNFLFERWVANRRGEAFYSNYRDWRRDNADNSGVLTQWYDNRLQNRGSGGLFSGGGLFRRNR